MRLTRTVQALSDTVTDLSPETRETLASVRLAADVLRQRVDKDAAETMREIRDSVRTVKTAATTFVVIILAFLIIDMIRENR